MEKERGIVPGEPHGSGREVWENPDIDELSLFSWE